MDEISDNDIEDIDDKKESEEETMETDNECSDEFDGEMTEEQLVKIKVLYLMILKLVFTLIF